MTGRPFAQVDVFGAAPQRGNPVAVVLDAEGVDDAALARFAIWTNLSETTFVLPPTTADADYRVRIFNLATELPFAGHPTLGTCHAWLEANPGHAGDTVVQECGAGLVTVRRDGDDAGLRGAAADPRGAGRGGARRTSCARPWASARADVVDAQWADNGPGWVALLLESAEAVLAVRPGYLDAHIGLVGLHPDGSPEVRALFPKDGAMVEDPVTGSLNAALAGWLMDTGRLAAPYVARQGTAVGREGRVHVSRDPDGTIWIGGQTVTCISGSVAL